MASERPNQLFRNKTAKIAAIPMIITALVVFIGVQFAIAKSR